MVRLAHHLKVGTPELTPAIPIRPVCGMLAGGAGPPALAPNPPAHMPERCQDDKTG